MDEATRDYLRALGILVALALFAAVFVAFPMSWSPMGQAQLSEQSQPDANSSVDLSQFDIPEGWAPGNGALIVVIDPTRTRV